MWNYRVIKKVNLIDYDEVEESYQIHEIYYEKDGSIRGWTQNPVKIVGDSLIDLKDSYLLMAQALVEPMLQEVTVETDSGIKTFLEEIE